MSKKLDTKEGLYTRFIYYVNKGYTHLQAYIFTMDDFEKSHGKPEHKGYWSYASFKNMVSDYLRN